MERIEELVRTGDLEAARKLIIDEEAKLSEEPSPHIRCALKREIVQMKSLYLSKIEKNLDSIKERSSVDMGTCSNSFHGNDRKRILSNLRSVKVDGLECGEASIEDCSDIVTGIIDTENSILIKNVINSEIRCRATQVRLIGCQHVSLVLYTKTGVYLQDSRDIAIAPLSPEPENMYWRVLDFTDPSGRNYTVLDQFAANKQASH